jgi:hypothetical protein
MNYGVVIVTYNRLELLKECIDACLAQTTGFARIIIVDNCSTDGTGEYLDGYEGDDRFVIVHEDKNLGGSGGFKVGLDIASRLALDWILIIDDDAIINKDYIERCDRFLTAYPEVVACSGTVKTDGQIQLIHRRRIGLKFCLLETNVPKDEYAKKAFRYDLATFCGLMVSGEVLRKVGLPKSEYFIWYDDTEFSMRLAEYGGIVNVNSAVLNHKTKLPSGDCGGFFERMTWRTYYGHRNRLDMVKNHCSKLTELCILAEFAVFIICAYLMQLVPSKKKQGRYIARLLKAAMRDGYNGRLGKNEEYSPD